MISTCPTVLKTDDMEIHGGCSSLKHMVWPRLLRRWPSACLNVLCQEETCRTNVANAVFAWLDVCSKTTEKKQRPSTTLTSQSIQPQYHAIPHPTITPMPQETGSTSPNIPQLLSNLPRPSTWPAPWGWSLHHFVPRRGTEAMCSEQGWKLRCKPSMCRWRMILQEPPHGLNNYVYYVYYIYIYIYVCVCIYNYIYISYHIISYHVISSLYDYVISLSLSLHRLLLDL